MPKGSVQSSIGNIFELRGISEAEINVHVKLNNENLLQVQDRGVRLASREVIKAIIKRTAYNGTRLYVVELQLSRGEEQQMLESSR